MFTPPDLDDDELDTFEGRWSANGALARIVQRLQVVSPDASVLSAWIAGLNRLEPIDVRDVFEGIGQVSKLIRNAQAEVATLEYSHKKRSELKWPKLKRLVNHSGLNEPFRALIDTVDDGVLERLIANHHALAGKSLPSFGNEYLTTLRGELFELISGVEKARDLAPELQIALLSMLEGLINAINAYRWTGPDGLRKELVEFNISLEINRDLFDQSKRHPLVQDTLKKVGLFRNILLWSRREAALLNFVATAFIAPVAGVVTLQIAQRAFPGVKVEQLLLPAPQPDPPEQTDDKPLPESPVSPQTQTPV